MSSKAKPPYIKAYEPWSTIFVTDIFAIPLTPLLASLGISPNTITIVSLISGLCSGVAFGFGHWFWGAVVFELAFLMDCLDGKIARLRNMASQLGQKLDFIADSTRKPSAFIGIAFFFYFNHQLPLVMLTIVAFVVHFAIHKLFSLAGVSEYDLEFPVFLRRVVRRFVPRLLNLYNFFDEQFIEFVVFPLIVGIIGVPKGGIFFCYGVGVVTGLGLLKLVNSLYYRSKGRYDEIYQDWAGTGGGLDIAEKRAGS